MAVTFRSLSSTSYGSSTNTTLTPPSGLADGDILIAVIKGAAPSLNNVAISAPAGFTQIDTDQLVADAGNFSMRDAAFWKRASSESGNYVFTVDGGTPCTQQGLLLCFQGAIASGSPIDASSQAAGSTVANGSTSAGTQSTTATAPSVTTTVADALVVYLAGHWGDITGSISPPSGFTERYDAGVMYAADRTQTSAGSSGSAATTVNSPANPWFARQIALKPAGGGGGSLAATSTIKATAKAGSAGRTPLQGRWLSTTRLAPNLTVEAPSTSAPTLIGSAATAFNTLTSPKTTSGIIVLSGDVIVAHGMMESAIGGTLGIATTSGSTSAWALLEDQPNTVDSSRPYLRTWWATVTSNGIVSAAFSLTGTAQLFGGIVKVYRNASGVGAAESTNNVNGSGAPSVSITTTQLSSALDYASIDWNAAPGSVTFVSSAGTPVQDLDTTVAGAYRVYSSHIEDVGFPGAKTIGISSPNTQRFAASAIEVFGGVNVIHLRASAALASIARAASLGRTTLVARVAASLKARGLSSGRVPMAGLANVASAATSVRSIALAMQTRFFPSMRGAISTNVSLGTAANATVRFRLSATTTRVAALAGKVAAAAGIQAGSGAFAALRGLANTVARARSTFSGTVVLAIQTRFFPAMRGALNAAAVPTAIALAAASAIMSRAKSTFSGRTSLAGSLGATSRAAGGLAAVTAFAGRSAAQLKVAAVVGARSAMSAAASVKAVGAGAMAGRIAMLGRAAAAFAARALVPGTAVALLARAAAATRITASVTGHTALAAKSATMARAAASLPVMAAFLRGLTSSATAVRTSASVTASIVVGASTKVAIRVGGTFSGMLNLAGGAKAAAAARVKRGFTPLLGAASARLVVAGALLSILRPVIPTPVHPRPGRLSRLRASLERAFGEEFDIEPMTSGVDVNARVMPDISRDALADVIGIWMGPTTSRSPTARGSIADDKAHNWNVSYPSVRFDDAAIAGTRKGDRLTRQLDGSVWYIERVVPDGFGRTTLQLTSRKRTTQ